MQAQNKASDIKSTTRKGQPTKSSIPSKGSPTPTKSAVSSKGPSKKPSKGPHTTKTTVKKQSKFVQFRNS